MNTKASLNRCSEPKIYEFLFFTAGLTNRPLVRDSDPGAPQLFLVCGMPEYAPAPGPKNRRLDYETRSYIIPSEFFYADGMLSFPSLHAVLHFRT